MSFETIVLATFVIAVVAALLGSLADRDPYARIGSGFLDVHDSDPVTGGSPLVHELEETRQLRSALSARRRAPSGPDRASRR